MPKDQSSEEYIAFEGMLDRLLTVSKADLKARIDAHKAASAANPNRRGPKRKTEQEREVPPKRKGRKGPRAVTPSDPSETVSPDAG